MATLIQANGCTENIEPKNGTDFTLKELQKYVNGCIEIIRLGKGEIMVVNEEGKFTEEENVEATQIAVERCAIFFNDYIAGDAVICKEEEVR